MYHRTGNHLTVNVNTPQTLSPSNYGTTGRQFGFTKGSLKHRGLVYEPIVCCGSCVTI